MKLGRRIDFGLAARSVRPTLLRQVVGVADHDCVCYGIPAGKQEPIFVLPDRVKLERTLCVQPGEYEERLNRAALEEKMADCDVEGIWIQ